MGVKRASTETTLSHDRHMPWGVPFEQVGTTQTATVIGTGTTCSLVHSAAAVNDLIVVVAYQRAGRTNGSMTITSSGLTFTRHTDSGVGGHSHGIFSAWAPDATQRTITMTSTGDTGTTSISRMGFYLLIIRGASTTDTINTSTYGQDTVSPVTISALTTSVSQTLAIAGLGTTDDNSLNSTSWDTFTGDNIGADGCHCYAMKWMDAAGSTGNLVITQTANSPDPSQYSAVAITSLGSS